MPLRTLFALVALFAFTPALPAPAAQPPRWAPDPALKPPPIPREFRALWVATVANIDWPSKRDLTPDQQRAEMLLILDRAADLNLNAIILQVRPACDALYPSTLEPWSEFLTGQSGSPPPGAPADYDPLRDWIDAAHARGLELHAWFNPFRARHFESKRPDAPTHVTNARPQWVRSYDQYQWLDPGEPAAQAHTLAVIADVVARYNLDGIHFDDYFYPYPKDKLPFPDDAPYAAYVGSFGGVGPNDPKPLARDDWRRDNINRFMQLVYAQTKAAKPWVRVGISPFGIWRPGFPPQVRGFDQYAGLYADARLWLRSGWLDYAAPQLYWKLDAPQQPFARLLDWWIDQNDQRRHVWPGLYSSRILAADAKDKDGKPAPSWEPTEIVSQIAATRTAHATEPTPGHIHFSAVALMQNRRGLADALAQGPYALPALPPAMPWSAAHAGSPAAPAAPTVEIPEPAAPDAPITLRWSGVAPGHRVILQARYGEAWTPARPRLPSTATPNTATLAPASAAGPLNAIALTTLDRRGVQSPTTVVSRRPALSPSP
jgi:uncharacterized lipoprotein YddW (UPF0748 family)